MRLFLLVGLAFAIASPSFAQSSLFTFDDASNRLAAASGPGTLTFRGTTSSIASLSSASSFGLPALPGGDTGVLYLPTLNAAQGLFFDHNAPPNGVHVPSGWVGNWTIVMDLLIPSDAFSRPRSLANTNLTNANDGDLFISAAGGIGANGNFRGSLRPGTWHRVAFVVGASDGEGMLQRFIDGRFVGGMVGVTDRWAAYANAGANQGMILFGDDNGQTGPIFVSSIFFADRRMTFDEIEALGGPHAAGASTPGPSPETALGRARPVQVIAHRGYSGQAPENTLASISAAADVGAHTCEIDIRLSSDGVAVLMHDSTLDRTTPRTGNANTLSAAELASVETGSFFDSAFASERVPTLAQALSLMRSRGVRPYLDVKVSGMGPAIRTAMQQAGLSAADLWIWAYNRSLAQEFRAAIPGAQVVVGEAPTTMSEFNALRQLGVVGFDIGWSGSLDQTFVALARANNMFVSVYTIQDPDDMLAAIAQRVDMMETDYPATLLGLLCAADFNRDQTIDFFDYLDFAAAFADDRLSADFNKDRQLDFFDFLDFASFFASGCQGG
ncbi:MAG: glycerophosphodiester phosphodiesterase family protein [Planctomycetota bacterium]|nr:glycerophosphodiester phosphodiesterase family protein [Planctomycetota bacterium]